MAASPKNSQLFGPTVYRGARLQKIRRVDFRRRAERVTESNYSSIWKKGKSTATFFMCGMNVKRLPDIAGQVADGGHQIGNHTYSHPNLPFKSRAFIDHEFTETQKIIQFETGVTPMLLRAPYGFRGWGMREVQQRLSLLSVMWTVVRLRLALAGRAHRPARLLSHCVQGAIVCLHDGRGVKTHPDIGATLTALRYIVPRLKDNGYAFETVSGVLSP